MYLISNADLQAVLWHHEKDLFATLGNGTATSEATDYEEAARRLVSERYPEIAKKHPNAGSSGVQRGARVADRKGQKGDPADVAGSKQSTKLSRKRSAGPSEALVKSKDQSGAKLLGKALAEHYGDVAYEKGYIQQEMPIDLARLNGAYQEAFGKRIGLVEPTTAE